MFNIKSFTIFVAFQVAAVASQEVDESQCPSTGLSYRPHYGNCSLFFECLNGNKIVLRCPADFAWSIPQNKCVPVEEADCSYTTVAPPDGQTCPATGISFLPHYSDCTKFFECIYGSKKLMHCPDEFAWSTIQNRCVIQSEADCSYTTIAPVDECPAEEISYLPVYSNCRQYIRCDDGVKSIETCDSGYAWSIIIQACDLEELVDCSLDECPAEGISYLPVYSNCRQYIRCDEGVKSIETCDSGYAWSAIIQACDLEELVDCSYTDCPAEGLHYFPVYTNCQQYMKCNYGTKSIETCPNEYAWSTVIQACELEFLVDCSDRAIPTSTKSTVPTTTTPTTTPTPTSTTTPKPTTINPAKICYRQPEGTFFPHPTDCSKFIECSHDQAVIMHCAASTTWDQELSVCDENHAKNCAGYPDN